MLVWIAALAALALPGELLLQLSRLAIGDPITRWSIRLALGLAFWPVAFLWTTTAGLTWSRALVIGVLIVAALGSIRRMRFGPLRPHLGFAIVLALTIASRLIQARELALPAWVDSVHHVAIVRMIVDSGTLPETWQPFFAGSFFYHWGYHVNAAVVGWVAGLTEPFELAQVVLELGQLLNILVAFAMYAVARTLFASRVAGVAAAALAMLWSYFPAYYLSWGRYPHLTGLLLLLPLLVVLARIRRRGAFTVAAILASGLLLIHVRIVVFGVTAALLLLAIRPRSLLRFAVAALLAIVIVAPWYLHATQVQLPRMVLQSDMPEDLLWAPHNKELLMMASGGALSLLPLPAQPLWLRAAGVAWLLTIVYLAGRRRFRARRFALVAAWIALTFGAMLLPFNALVPKSAAIITLFVPLGLLGGGLLAWVVRGRAWVVVALALAAFPTTLDVVNPATVIATRADLDALGWIDANVSRDARFAVAARPWLGGAWRGIDGGYWVPVLTRRASIVPPALYHWSASAADADRINATIERVGNAETFPRIEPGITHVYARGALRLPGARCVYARGGVEVWDVQAVTAAASTASKRP